MDNNLGYLLAVFGIAWLVTFGYIWFMINKQKKLRQRLDELKRDIDGKGVEH